MGRLFNFIFQYILLVSFFVATPVAVCAGWTVVHDGEWIKPGYTDIWGTSSSDIWIMGTGVGSAMHYDGTSWNSVNTGSDTLSNIWGTSSTKIYAAGPTGQIYHYDGNSWRRVKGPDYSITHIWGTSASDVYAVGNCGMILHFNGQSWSRVTSEHVKTYLWAIWGPSSTDIFAAGADGTILHYDGQTWSVQSTPVVRTIRSLWGASGSNVFAVGDGGMIMHYDGSQWSRMESGVIANLTSVWGTSGSNVYAVGQYGTILHYDGSSWSSLCSPSGTAALQQVWGFSESEIYVIGGHQTLLMFDGVKDTCNTPKAYLYYAPNGRNCVGNFTGCSLDNVDWRKQVPYTQWRPCALGDFNNDGKDDVIWRNSAQGRNAVVYPSGSETALDYELLPSFEGPEWRIAGTADFNGDNNTDIVWHNTSTGGSGIWLMDGLSISSRVFLSESMSGNWSLVGVGDLNNDGDPDLLWRNYNDGANLVWYMDGSSISSRENIESESNVYWRINSVSDVNGDGKDDIIWVYLRNSYVWNGYIKAWIMDGGAKEAEADLLRAPSTSWWLIGFGTL